jgi:hypothetical protein
MDGHQQVDSLVDEIKGTTGFLRKILFNNPKVLLLVLIVGAVVTVTVIVG